MPEEKEKVSDIAVLVVHGIGAQCRYDTLRKLLNGVQREKRNYAPYEIQDGLLTEVFGQRVRFYEVYWADLHRGEAAFRSFNMDELQSLSWFPLLNYRSGNYRRGEYPLIVLWAWFLVLPIISIFSFSLHIGAPN